jgi:hypothetical protein
MTRRLDLLGPLGLLAMVALVGCRPSAPPVADAPSNLPAQPSPTPVQPDTRPDLEYEAPELVAVEHEAPPGVLPPGVDAPESACEQSCGDVHACVLIERSYTPSAAAAIELGCVGACLHTPERATLFGCRRPPTIEPGPCSPFLACVAASWPDSSVGEPTIAPVLEHQHGCAQGCEAYARCWDPTTTPDRIAQCTELCQQALDDEHERLFGACAELPDCADITACVTDTPGA